MTPASSQLGWCRPRIAGWIGAVGIVVLGTTTLSAQNTLAGPSGDNGVVAPARESSRRAFVGSVVGRVTDARTATPVVGAVVEVEGLQLAGSTGDDGRYRILGVPAGSRVIVVRRLGYTSTRRTVTVTDDQQTTADFALAAAAVSLDQVVVTGTAGGEHRRSIGNSVATIDVKMFAFGS